MWSRSMIRLQRLAGLMVPVLTVVHASYADEAVEVTVNYVLAPPRPLPEGLRAVAVIDAGVQTRGASQNQREQKWSKLAADMIESMLANSAARFGSGLQVAQRRLTKQILEERDLRLAGLVDGPTAEQAGKLLAVQGLIASQITVHIDTQTTRKSTIDWAQLLGMAAQVMVNGNRGGPAPVLVPAPAPASPPPPVARPRSASQRPTPTPRPTYLRQNRAVTDPRDRRANPVTPYDVDPRNRDPRTLRYRRYAYDQRYQVRPGVIMPPPGAVVVSPAPVMVPVAPAPVPAPIAVPAPATMPPGAGPVGVGMREVEEVSRHLTVQCSFTLLDAVTGQAIVIYQPPPYRKVDKATPDFLFGSMHDTQLDPVDHFIGELVERGVQEFVSLLVPTEVEYRYEVLARHSRGEAGVRALRADDLETAQRQFESEARKYDDEPEPRFALGVISELLGNPQQALDFYRQAVSMDDIRGDQLQVYLSAKNRLTDHLPRIMKAPPAGIVYPAQGAAGSPDPPRAGGGFGFDGASSPPRPRQP